MSAIVRGLEEQGLVQRRSHPSDHRATLVEATAEGGEIIERVVRQACEVGTPVLAVLDTSGADVTEGVASLHAWGRVASALAGASGIVPIVIVVTGACVSGPALLLGLADAVIMTDAAFAYVSGPAGE